MNRKSIPNLLSAFRVILILPVLVFIFRQQHAAAAVLIAIAVFTDGLDGFLARQYSWRTRMGGILDPIADKLLFVSVFLALGATGHIAPWLVALVIGRDLVIAGGALAYERLIGPVEAQPTWLSKINTVVLFFFTAAVLLQLAGWTLASAGLVKGLELLVVATVVTSGVQYVWVWGRRALREGRA